MFWTGAVAPPKEGHPPGGRRPGLRAIPPLRCRRVVCRRCRDIRPRTLPYPVSSAWRTAADRLRGALGRDMRLRSPSLSLAYHIRRHRPCCCARTGRTGHHALVLVPVANRSALRNRKTPAFSRPLISAPSQNAASVGRLAGSLRSGLVSSSRPFGVQSHPIGGLSSRTFGLALRLRTGLNLAMRASSSVLQSDTVCPKSSMWADARPHMLILAPVRSASAR